MMVLKCPVCGKEGPPPEERPADEPAIFMEARCTACIVIDKNPPEESE